MCVCTGLAKLNGRADERRPAPRVQYAPEFEKHGVCTVSALVSPVRVCAVFALFPLACTRRTLSDSQANSFIVLIFSSIFHHRHPKTQRKISSYINPFFPETKVARPQTARCLPPIAARPGRPSAAQQPPTPGRAGTHPPKKVGRRVLCTSPCASLHPSLRWEPIA